MRLVALKSGFRLLSALRADGWLASSWSVAVLMLHRVRPADQTSFRPNAHLEITPDFLDEILGRLAEHRIDVVSLEEAAARVRRGARGRAVVLTLDDGYRDNHQHALPILRRRRLPFTVFVASGMIDGTANAWWLVLEAIVRAEPSVEVTIAGTPQRFQTRTLQAKCRAFSNLVAALWQMDEGDRDRTIRALAERHGFDIPALLAREMMTWDEVREIAATPGASIGGHTVSHPALALLDDSAAEREIREGLDRLEQQVGKRPTTFAYPYGNERAVSQRDIDLVARLGIDVAVTTERGMIAGPPPAMTAWPRVTVNGLFQNRRDFDMLMSGAPFKLEDGLRRIGLVGPRRRGALVADGRSAG